MLDVQSNNPTPDVITLDSRARQCLGVDCTGVSTGGYGSVIHLIEGSSLAAQAAALLTATDTLTVLTDKVTLTADGVDTATITCNTVEEIGYTVLLDGGLYATGNITPVAGVATETLAVDDAGSYVVTFWEKAGAYPSGSVTIEATE